MTCSDQENVRSNVHKSIQDVPRRTRLEGVHVGRQTLLLPSQARRPNSVGTTARLARRVTICVDCLIRRRWHDPQNPAPSPRCGGQSFWLLGGGGFAMPVRLGGGGFAVPVRLSGELQNLLGSGETLSRCEVVKQRWAYIKTNDLQNPSKKTQNIPDD